ncbi:sigma 54-interacting transcriptional regulator [Paramaledivibacter caminithermalis]|jgi:PAS domain S-box-containing protein|uniref:PAS domain S-box-containing protein n=1 Tax=Paramaledivibacter caminithermalis (strain DSM 15212 / CIP 107654 / DViRD3) TaxID=1121301 RepID=A0A1M6MP07_PARC5|nr:sigma 54-interacting transcriptional regulator [Paramaledivibacter caminithermalis]SHJ85174.1 PAS domain S-box-containing protein [Paramaledivibacter caminithermalis DSM 15212]
MCTEIIKYLSSMLCENDRKYNKEFEIVNTSFRLYDINFDKLNGILLLLDDHNTVINIKEVNKHVSNFIGRTLKLPLDKKINNGKIIKYTEKNFSVYYLKVKSNKNKEISYGLCYIIDSKSDSFEVLVEDIAFKINKSIEILHEYNKKNNFLMEYLDSIDEGISTCDRNGRITYVNKACCEILGFNKEDIVNGKKEISPEYKPILSKLLLEKKSIIDVDYFPRKNNKTIHLINSSYPVFNNKKEVIGAIDIFRGIKRTTKLANTLVGQNITYKFENIIGESSILKEKIGLAKSFALSDANIYIQGESGTGKELFAQSIHNYSRRKNEPFIALNCANFPLDLVDSELFGYEEGAFTGAKKGGKIGKFELANGGTLFLDEIGEMQLHTQAKLLRVLETRTLFRIGGNKPIKINVKIIAATNKNLYNMVKKGEFREDLYYRLKVLFLEIPPLRERENDVLILADYFTKKIGMDMGKNIKEIDKEGKKLLCDYHWPGNIRELENIIARALFICDKDIITKDDLIKAGISLESASNSIKNDLQEINKEILIRTLKQTKGNKKRTAEILGVSRPTIYRMIKKYNVKL